MTGDFSIDTLHQQSTVHFEVAGERIVKEEVVGWHFLTEQVELVHYL